MITIEKMIEILKQEYQEVSGQSPGTPDEQAIREDRLREIGEACRHLQDQQRYDRKLLELRRDRSLVQRSLEKREREIIEEFLRGHRDNAVIEEVFNV